MFISLLRKGQLVTWYKMYPNYIICILVTDIGFQGQGRHMRYLACEWESHAPVNTLSMSKLSDMLHRSRIPRSESWSPDDLSQSSGWNIVELTYQIPAVNVIKPHLWNEMKRPILVLASRPVKRICFSIHSLLRFINFKHNGKLKKVYFLYFQSNDDQQIWPITGREN